MQEILGKNLVEEKDKQSKLEEEEGTTNTRG